MKDASAAATPRSLVIGELQRQQGGTCSTATTAAAAAAAASDADGVANDNDDNDNHCRHIELPSIYK